MRPNSDRTDSFRSAQRVPLLAFWNAAKKRVFEVSTVDFEDFEDSSAIGRHVIDPRYLWRPRAKRIL